MLLTAQKAASRAGISVYMLRRHGPTPVRIGGRLYWRDTDIDAFIGTAQPDDREEVRKAVEAWAK